MEAAFGLSGVTAVVHAACAALGRVRGLQSLRWGGLAALLAHLHPAAMERALAQLQHVSRVVAGQRKPGQPSALLSVVTLSPSFPSS